MATTRHSAVTAATAMRARKSTASATPTNNAIIVIHPCAREARVAQ